MQPPKQPYAAVGLAQSPALLFVAWSSATRRPLVAQLYSGSTSLPWRQLRKRRQKRTSQTVDTKQKKHPQLKSLLHIYYKTKIVSIPLIPPFRLGAAVEMESLLSCSVLNMRRCIAKEKGGERLLKHLHIGYGIERRCRLSQIYLSRSISISILRTLHILQIYPIYR